MGYSVAFLGDLSFGAAGAARWLASLIDPSTFAEWPEDWTPEIDEKLTVGKLLDEAKGDFHELDRRDASVRLRLLVSKDDWFYSGRRMEMLCAFRQAAAHGGTGSLAILGWNDAPQFGVRATMTADGKTTCSDLDKKEIKSLEKTLPYTELEAIVEREVAKLAMPDLQAKVSEKQKKEADAVLAIAKAPTIEKAFAVLRKALPEHANHYASERLPKSPLIAALAAHGDPRATQVMRDALRDLLGGPLAGDKTWKAGANGYLENGKRIFALALVWALHGRGGAEDAVAHVWIDHPDFFLRNHAAVRALGRRELDLRLVAQLGQERESTDSHDCIIEALIATDPEGAPARATALLEGDPRETPGNLAALESLARYFYEHDDQRSPAWEQWLRDVERSHPWSDETYDQYDQMRRNAIGVMANWKMPEALAPLLEHFEAFGVQRACELLEELGDRAAVPSLEAHLAKTRRKAERARIEATIEKLGGPVKKAAAGTGTTTKKTKKTKTTTTTTTNTKAKGKPKKSKSR